MRAAAVLVVGLCLSSLLPGQDPGGQDPVRVLPTIGRELYYPDAIEALRGKPVRSIQVTRLEPPGESVPPLDATTTESIVRGLDSRVGQPFEPRKVTADVRSLWSERRLVVTAYAEEVDGEVVLTYQVDLEVQSYEGDIEFVGFENLDEETIHALVGYYPGRRTTRTEAEAMRKLLLARYRRDGYAFCSIELDDRKVDAAGAVDGARPGLRLRMRCDEGPKVRVRRLDFVGNHSFPAEPILALFGTGSYLTRDARIDSDPSYGVFSGGAFSREVLEEDLDRLRLFYRSRGFLEASVDLGDVRFTEDRSAVDLTIFVVEGPRYRIRSVRVEHVDPEQRPLAEPPLYPAEEVAAVLKVEPGEFYDHDRLQRDREAIEEFYGRRGHPPASYPGMAVARRQACEVFQPREYYGDGAEVDIVFMVSEGEPKTLRDIVIRGNRFTRDAVIRRNFRVLPGQRIDMLEVRRAIQRLESTRYFTNAVTLRGPRLQLEPVPGSPDQVDIGLDLEDAPTGELRWGVSVSPGIGAQAMIQFNKRNFDLWNPPSSANPITALTEILDQRALHGGGQTLSTMIAPGSRQSQFSISYFEPDWFGDHHDPYTLRVTGTRQIRRLPDGYTSDRFGGEIGVGRFLTEHFSVNAAVRHESVKIGSLAQDATVLAFDAEGVNELRGMRFTVRYQDFDNYSRPTQGFDANLSFEVLGGPFGADVDLTKWVHRLDAYYPLAENEMGHRTVFHWRQFLGYAQEYGSSDDVFLTERFYMGGPDLRGFEYRRAGPTQFGRPLGGTVKYTSSFEIYFPLVATRLEGEVRDRELLRWVLFTDVGFLGLATDHPTFGEMRLSSGVGLRIEIPYLELPIALDLGWPWFYEETDDRGQLWFSIRR